MCVFTVLSERESSSWMLGPFEPPCDKSDYLSLAFRQPAKISQTQALLLKRRDKVSLRLATA